MNRVEGLNIRHSPASGLLQIGLRLAGSLPPGTVHGRLRGLPPLTNAAVEIIPAPGGEIRVEATAVLPPGVGPEAVRLLLSSGEAPLLSLAPLPAVQERAGLATLEPLDGGGAAVRDDDPRQVGAAVVAGGVGMVEQLRAVVGAEDEGAPDGDGLLSGEVGAGL